MILNCKNNRVLYYYMYYFKVFNNSSGWSFQGTWDPKEAAFAVLNQVSDEFQCYIYPTNSDLSNTLFFVPIGNNKFNKSPLD